jgi:RNA binding exosome subunit
MALRREDITQAYMTVFGGPPAESEIREIMAKPSYWGNNIGSVAQRLTESNRFLSQPVNKDTITRAWTTFFGGPPAESEINEVLAKPGYWGRNVAVLTQKIKASGRYAQDPRIKVTPAPPPAPPPAPTSTAQQSSAPAVQPQRNDDSLNAMLRQIGLSDDIINRMDPESKMFYGTIGNQLMSNIEKLIPAPTTFNADTFKQLYEQAKNNPKINQFYEGIQSRKVEDILNNIAISQEDYDFTNRQMATQFTKQVEDLAAQTEQAGMLYSGIRQRNEAKLAQQQGDIIQSTQSQAKRQLQDIGRQAEELLGSKAVNDLKLGLRQPTNLGVGINTQVAQQLQQPGNLGYTGYGTAITSEQSALGQAKQAEISAEYERLKAERTLLTNPQQST